MSIFEFLERLEADPFYPALVALFLGKPQNAESEPEEAGAEPADDPEE